jgi:phosphoenolpyruvate carboxykinase (ATP)
MSLKHTRSIITAILNGALTKVETCKDPIFGLYIPAYVPDVPTDILNPRNTWADKTAYDAKATELAHQFKENFKQFSDQAGPEVLAAGPKA